MSAKSIHTLDARDNIMLEVLRDHFKLSPEEMFREIQQQRLDVEEILKRKGISYDLLKSALVPDRQRKEIALVFDSMSIKSSWYGNDVFKRLIPLFEKKSNHSVLAGDYLDHGQRTAQLFDAFEESVSLRRDIEFVHPTQFYIVYINNLTDAMIKRFDDGLRGYDAYVGIADMNYKSRLKIYLSTMLTNSFIKHRNIIIQGHEPDRDETEDVNMLGYNFEASDFTCRSLSADLMGLMLSYKIERPVFPGFESDTHFALNSVSASPLPIENFAIEIADSKLEYFNSQKLGSMSRAGLLNITSQELSEIIQHKVSDSYIYNMAFNSEYNVVKFNVIVEIGGASRGPQTRLLASLEYRPEEQKLRLITLY